MFIDNAGQRWFKGNLHMHTTVSDGRKSPEDAIRLYREHGYDFLALTDHWHVSEGEARDGMLLLSGCEYDFHRTVLEGIFHIVSIGAASDPGVVRADTPQAAIDKIHAAGGLAILAHPAWSLNTPEQILALHGFDATEIFNSVSDLPHNCRPYSGLTVDMLAARGLHLPLTAADDAHFYDGADACRSYILVQAEECTREALLAAICAGRLYATQGPELRVTREGRRIRVACSPARSIVFFTDAVWNDHRADVGEGLTEAVFDAAPHETFVRVEVTDEAGRSAWSPIIPLPAPQN